MKAYCLLHSNYLKIYARKFVQIKSVVYTNVKFMVYTLHKCKIQIVILFMSRIVEIISWVNLYRSRLMRQGKRSYQERNYSTIQCDNTTMSQNYLLYSSVESITILIIYSRKHLRSLRRKISLARIRKNKYTTVLLVSATLASI